MDKVTFETNTWQTLALKYAKGKEAPSTIDGYPDQMRYTTADNRVMYLNLPVAEKLDGLNLRAGEQFRMRKAEVRSGPGKPTIEWQIERPASSEPAAPNTASLTTTGNGGNDMPSVNSKFTPPTKIPMDYALAMFVLMAGRATRATEQILGHEGGSVRFDSRDVAALATTMFIQAGQKDWLCSVSAKTAQQYISELKIDTLTREAVVSTQVQAQTEPAQSMVPVSPNPTRPLPATGPDGRAVPAVSSPGPVAVPANQNPWTDKNGMQRCFAEAHELVGVVRYAQEMALAGVQKWQDFTSKKAAVECYRRMMAIAELEREVA